MTPPRDDASAEQLQQQPQQQSVQQQQQQGLGLASEPSTATYYNSSSNSNHGSSHNNNTSGEVSFNTELFTDQYDEVVKQEYEDDEYRSIPFQEQLQQYSPAEPAQLLELQTPQQQQQLQQQQQQQQQFQTNYESQFQQQPAQFNNNSVISTAATSTVNHQPITAVAYINSSNNTISVATNANGGMPAPVPAQVSASVPAAAPVSTTNNAVVGASPVPVPRKRGRPFGSVNPPHADSLEALYMEEVRRKNQLLYEQTKICRQRLELEERKVDLMQTFFPKCLEQQAQILSHVLQLQQQHQHPTAQRPQ